VPDNRNLATAKRKFVSAFRKLASAPRKLPSAFSDFAIATRQFEYAKIKTATAQGSSTFANRYKPTHRQKFAKELAPFPPNKKFFLPFFF